MSGEEQNKIANNAVKRINQHFIKTKQNESFPIFIYNKQVI